MSIVVIKYLIGVFKCLRNYLIQNLMETKFVNIFGRAKEIISFSYFVNLVHTKPTVRKDVKYEMWFDWVIKERFSFETD